MKLKMLFASLGTCMICGANAFSLFYSDAIVNKDKYSVMGVDVAHYQGVIDWNKLEEQGVDFAFIKATEGSGHVDCFSKSNLNNISKTNIYHSAYHFFSFDSSGETQAENYISAVDKNKINLPPVIDVEYYGNKSKENPSEEETCAILSPLLSELESYYGKKPIIYTTLPLYFKYIKNNFSDHTIWIRNINCEPSFINWTFWQYSDKGKLEGYDGIEENIDLNVYNGSMQEFIEEFNGGKNETTDS